MKKILSILLLPIILILIIKWDYIQEEAKNSEQIVLEAFNSISGKIFSTSLTACGDIQSESGKKGLELIVDQLINDLNLQQSSVSISKDYSDNIMQIYARGQDNDNSIISIRIISNEVNQYNPKSTLNIDVYHDGEYDIEKIYTKIKKTFLQKGSVPEINKYITGTVDRMLDVKAENKFERKISGNINSQFTREDTNRKKYTPALADIGLNSTKTANEKFSYKYSSEEKKTYIRVTVPLIN